jgi:lysophospholipase L1-like esterase
MPSGDSITVGAQSTDTGGYRAPLFGLTLENGKNLTFVGPSGAGPESVDGEPFPDAHDGHSGYVIDTVDSRKGLLPLMQQNLTQHAPHIVLLMIGTNDINSDVDVVSAPNRLATLIDEITGTAPESLLVVAPIIPTRTDELNLKVQAFNAAIPAIVSERVAAGKHVLLADMYGAFSQNPAYKTELLYDGLHPNDAGYAVMAETWYAAIAAFLSARP